MPRILCLVRRQFGDARMPFVVMRVRSRSPPVSTATLALVDTGSPYSGLSPKDVLKSRMRLRGQKGQSIGLAGMTFLAPVMKGATVNFQTEEGTPVSYEAEGYRAFVPTKKMDQKMEREIQSIPSLVGSDFLEAHGIALYFDPKANIAYLEIP